MNAILQCFCHRLSEDCPRLTKLNLAGTWIDPDGAVQLAQALEHNTHLRDLNLRRNEIAQGVQALASILCSTSLQKLVLSRNSITNVGAASLGQSLFQPSTSLRVLILSFNEISAQGAVALSRGLAKNHSLVELVMTGNDIGNEGAAALGTALESNSTLQSLGVRKCNISRDGVVALAKSLQRNDTLQKLDLYFNKIGTAGFQALQEMLEHDNFTLQELLLWNKNKVDMSRINHCLLGNKAGRRCLRDDAMPSSLWPFVLARVSFDKPPDLLYYLIQEKPDLFSGAR